MPPAVPMTLQTLRMMSLEVMPGQALAELLHREAGYGFDHTLGGE
jgi:hypothetical protein